MHPLAILLLCFQTYFIQAVFGSCGCGIRSGPAAIGYSTGLNQYSAGTGQGGVARYNAKGNGDVSAYGELDVIGDTSVSGSVAALGDVTFRGLVPANGFVTISGSCAYPQPINCGAAIAGAELAGFNAGLAGAAGVGAAIAGAEFAGFNSGLAGAAGVGASIAGAELAGFNSGLAGAAGVGSAIAGAELAGAAIAGAELAGAAIAGAELAGFNTGLAGAAGVGAAIADAELAGMNAGFAAYPQPPVWSNAPVRAGPACGCSSKN